jgi:predicted metal-dependent peptidase
MRSVRDDVDRAAIKLLLAEPFFGHYLLGLRKEVTEGAAPATIAIDGGAPCLAIGAASWGALSEARKQGALKHEVLHLVFRHPMRRPDFGDAALFNLCADLVVNEYLAPAQRAPGEATLEDFPFLERDRSVDVYYAKLRDHSHQPESCAEPFAQLLDEEAPGQRRHRPWAQVAALGSLEKNLLDVVLAAHLAETAKRAKWNDLGGALQRLIALRTSKRPSLDWRRMLRLFVSTAADTFLKNTVHRPSKRYGTIPGFKIKPRQNVAVVIDTSGSISAGELALFDAELRHIHRAGARVEVLECDAEVQRVYPYRGRLPEGVKGGGGTNADPALARCNRSLPDALVYLTDGFLPVPSVKPRYPILWMITPRGRALADDEIRALPGRKAKIVHEVS